MIDTMKIKEEFKKQTLFVLEFRNTIEYEEVIERLDKYNIKFAFSYSTSTNNKKEFNVVFVHSNPLIPERILTIIVTSFKRLFVKANVEYKRITEICIETKNIIDYNEYSFFNVYELVQAICRYLKETDKGEHFARNIKHYCETVGLHIINGMPAVIENEDAFHYFDNEKFGGLTSSPFIYTNTQEVNPPKNILLLLSDNVNKYDAKKEVKKYSINKLLINKAGTLRHVKSEELEEKCGLYNEFVNDKVELNNNQLFGLMTNLANIERIW